MASKQTDARTAIIALMRDGRERNLNDVYVRVRGDREKLLKVLRRLAFEGLLMTDAVDYGSKKMTTYRIAQAEAAE